jgi:hypothetical protein
LRIPPAAAHGGELLYNTHFVVPGPSHGDGCATVPAVVYGQRIGLRGGITGLKRTNHGRGGHRTGRRKKPGPKETDARGSVERDARGWAQVWNSVDLYIYIELFPAKHFI